jgi:predicted amidophosphoribosyltransferase
MDKKTSPYIAKIDGAIGVYCTNCQSKLNEKDKICPGCFRKIKSI